MWKSLLLGLVFFAIVATAYGVEAIAIENPIAAKSFPALIQQISKAVRTIAFPIAIIAIVFVGFRFVTHSASGNSKGLEEDKKMFFWVLIGTAVIVGASVLADAVVDFAKKL